MNILTGLNLTERYYLKEESFIKLTEFVKTEIKNPNK